MASEVTPQPLSLFPLRTVLFPGGRLPLKVFEARYLDLMGECLRTGEPFGVVCITQGSEVGTGAADGFGIERVGVMAQIQDVDLPQPGIMMVQCLGTQRFRLVEPPTQGPNGLWRGLAQALASDPARAIDDDGQTTARALADVAQRLKAEGTDLFAGSPQWNDAGWVANRWCELLPINLPAKQRLMELDDPGLRLQIVDDFLRQRQVITG